MLKLNKSNGGINVLTISETEQGGLKLTNENGIPLTIIGGNSMNFGQAIEAAKTGKHLRRVNWNGKGMFVVYQKGYPDGIPCNKQTAAAWGLNEGDLFVCNPYLQIRCADGTYSMWVPSINDVLAEDWEVVK